MRDFVYGSWNLSVSNYLLVLAEVPWVAINYFLPCRIQVSEKIDTCPWAVFV